MVVHQESPSSRERAVKEPLGPSWKSNRSKSSSALLQDCSSASRGSLGRASDLKNFQQQK